MNDDVTNPQAIAIHERPAGESGVSVTGPEQTAGMGGAYEGADRVGRELASWNPIHRPADGEINPEKELMDARARDVIRNTGIAQGASAIHRDSIVGAHYRLNARPNYTYLKRDRKWAAEFAREVEAKFRMYAESDNNWLDAARMNTLTAQVRLAVAGFFAVGEVLATVEWLRDGGRPYNTALQMIDPDRLSNPMGMSDSDTLRRGVVRNQYGAPQGYHIRVAHPRDTNAVDSYRWRYVPIRKPWGRRQVIHLIEQVRVDQTRGVADMVAVLKNLRMTKKFDEIVLQKAIVQASYAATIESDLPPDAAFATIGANLPGAATDGAAQVGYAQNLLNAISQYVGGSRNLQIDGVKIPHLFPGTKLNLQSPAGQDGVGTEFEESQLRHIAAALGVSYEELSRDYTKTNYSSSRASSNNTRKFMLSRKKVVADRYAGCGYRLWLEEAVNKGDIEAAKGIDIYEAQNLDALAECSWIGASGGQVDELKETQAAVLRIKNRLSTYEIEAARLGYDFRDIFEQSASEEEQAEELGIDLNPEPTKPGTLSSERGSKKPAADEDTEED